MIEYIIASNPDHRILERVVKIYQEGGIVALPTDTHWVLTASPYAKKGVEELYRIKGVDRKKHLTLLCKSISQAAEFAAISNSVFRQIHRVVPGPYTFIFTPNKNLPKVIKGYEKQKEIGIRIPSNALTWQLINYCQIPLLSASITPTMLAKQGQEGAEHIYAQLIEELIGSQIALILDPGEFEEMIDSTVVDFSTGDRPTVVRAGAGDFFS